MKIPALVLTTCVALAAPADAQDTANGKRLYLKDGCYECHGYAGNGSQGRTRLAQTPLTQDGFLAYVRTPAPGEMPPYRAKTMSDQELADVYAYVKTFPKSQASSTVPMLSTIRLLNEK